jgi:polyisoprenoid-binding protein YceI
MRLSVALSGAALAIAGTVFAGAASAQSYTVDARHTYPMFMVKHLGYSMQLGRFNGTTGKIMIDRAAKKGSVELAIDAASIDMGLAKWDEHMKAEDFFDVAKHPKITFKSSNVKFDGDKVVGADGELTLRGVTKPVSVALAGFHCAAHPIAKKEACGGDASATIKRSDFGMDYGLPGIGDEVKLMIPVEAFKD